MSKTTINFVLDILLAIVFLVVLWTAAVLEFLFPSGSRAIGWTLWGFDKPAWAALHFRILFAFGVMVLIHVMLHWSWVCGVAMKMIARATCRPMKQLESSHQTLIGVGVLVVLLHLLGILYLSAMLTIHQPAAT
ncbi:hypothetical protein Pan216_38640 [Planctomycetes bacterium Pan216]|uniref:Flavinylation-associated cytochrome domain-containing protein n=1 Tax=Kolteria novifilia TaxID=2527975 RepID=A0A518B7N7_9BACT|nr:hypothetical protein Pan216_38640 [Planctomycetes bacterium Pan216]